VSERVLLADEATKSFGPDVVRNALRTIQALRLELKPRTRARHYRLDLNVDARPPLSGMSTDV
jgi:hypothetical protein